MKNNKQRSGFSLWKMIGAIALLLICAALVIPMVSRPRETVRYNGCPSNLKQIGIALMQYNQDYDEHLPLIAVSPTSNVTDRSMPYEKMKFYGWADALWPYTKSQRIFQCPTQPQKLDTAKPFAPTERGFTDYWLNSNLNGLSFKKVSAVPANIIALGDGNDGGDLTDARYNLPSLPAAWLTDVNLPAYRHKGMANYAFLDGHVKALPPDQITSEPTANGKPTFAVK